MTATDSSHLEPDIHDSDAGPTQQTDTSRDASESPVVSAESVPPAAASAAASNRESDSGEEASEERPRATRVAEGAWLGGVCTGLARHLGWPLLAVRIALAAVTHCIVVALSPTELRADGVTVPPMSKCVTSIGETT